jgi:glycosyltransferase involved in cell wall biosynthesis
MNRLRTSVLINVHNGEDFLKAAIESVLDQSLSAFEIVVVDNCSTDLTGFICSEFAEHIRYQRLPIRVSLGRARNIGIELCQGDLVSFLDADDLWHPAKIEQTENAFQDRDVALCYSDAELTGLVSGLVSNRNQMFDGTCKHKFLQNYPIAMSAATIRTSLLTDLDFTFDESLEILEDFDLFIRLAAMGTLKYIDHPLVTVKVHSMSTGLRDPLKLIDEFRHVVSRVFESTDEHVLFKKALRRLVSHQIQLTLLSGRKTDALTIARHHGSVVLSFVVWCAVRVPQTILNLVCSNQSVIRIARVLGS